MDQRPQSQAGVINWSDTTVLVSGGTGSFGQQFARTMLSAYHPKKLIIFSRGELKQHEMRVNGFDHPSLRYFIGDVRDVDRLRRAMQGVDVVVHAAALKQVPACEYNPLEAVKTNIEGAKNIIDAALDTGVRRVLALSTDKAVNPVNLYGATKLVAEKLFAQANAYSGAGPTCFSCVRYGNVVGSGGSVVPLFLEQRKSGTITVTDRRMTRFWLTLDQGVRFVIRAIERMRGGEVFIPKIASTRLMDLAETIAPGCLIREIGIRPGEKLHEVLLSEDEARSALEYEDMYVVPAGGPGQHTPPAGGRPLNDGFRYASDTNTHWLTGLELLHLAEMVNESSRTEEFALQ
ncbi:MAG: UDP-N-acetylglucosamine 4,6-dehydratase (inverting) [Acidobacteriia bacterium]|nr:UDP-N-acetylglucosamine 4,6-dehydratase (inverting) [Terriglobia bacterium]